MSNLNFAETHNLVAFLEKPKESDGFEGIIDFLNSSSIRYTLMVNPIIYTSCIKQFWATAKANPVNGEVQIQALVDGKKVIITETSMRRVLKLKDAEGTDCLPTATIFAELERMGYEKLTQKKKQSRRKQRQDTKVPQPSNSTNDVADENIPTHSNDLPQSGKDRLQLNELMEIYTNLQKKVLDLEASETAQDQEILSLKQRVKKLEKKKKSKPHGLIRLYKGKNDDNLLFDTGVLDGQEVMADKDVSTADPVTTANVEVTTSSATTTTEEQTPASTPIVSSSQPSQVKDKVEEEEERLVKEKNEANIALTEEWDNVQAMIDADYQMAKQLQLEEQEQLTIKEKSKLFIQLLEARKKHFTALRAREKRNKPPTQAQQRKILIKKQKIDDDQEEAEMKQHMEIVIDEEEIAVDAILLAIKPPIIVDMKIIKEGKIGYFQIIRANRSSK
ncbi:hypothetical protein Tco_0870963, partial [Tanacetum coccineum]